MIAWLKALRSMRHGGRPSLVQGLLRRTRFDYPGEVGSGIDASVVTAPVQFMQRAFPEAPLRVMARMDGQRQEVRGHPLIDLVGRPNPFYSGNDLFAATIFSYATAGNAYWIKARDRAGRVVELWYTPHWLIRPKWPEDGSAFISRYEYKPGGGAPAIDLEPDDVVHFRHGVDPRNPRLGLAPLHGCLREIFMDLEASNFVASLLHNTGVPGLVLSPEGGAQARPEDVEAVNAWLREAFGGDRRGKPLVMGQSTKVEQFGHDPKALDLSAARNVAEERVCAALGIPAAVIGFGAGLETAKVGATMKELRKLAWTNGIIPMQRAFAATLNRALLPELPRGRGAGRAEFDASKAVALSDVLLRRTQRWSTAVQGGFATVAEARRANGLPVDGSHRIFLRSFSQIEVPAGGSRPASRNPEAPRG